MYQGLERVWPPYMCVTRTHVSSLMSCLMSMLLLQLLWRVEWSMLDVQEGARAHITDTVAKAAFMAPQAMWDS